MHYYLEKKLVGVSHFYTKRLKAIIPRENAFDEIRAYHRIGLPILIMLSLCLVFQPFIQAQEVFVRPPSIESNTEDSIKNNNHDTRVIVNSSPQNTVTNKKLFYFALKNNLIYDAALLPNLAAEVYLGKQFSLAIDGNWSWWTFKSDRFHRIQSVGADFRYWINSPSPLRGHAIGIYSMVGNYDIRLFTKNEDSKGWLSYGSWSAGLSYAYSVPIASRVNLEFGLAVGYLGGKYYDYNYCMMHKRWERQAERNRKYFGPTRAGISVVWQFGNGYNIKNGDVYTRQKKSY